MRSLYYLMMIVAISWVLILVLSYIFFAVIRPLGPPLHSGPIPSTVVKIAGSIALGAIWFVVMGGLRGYYIHSRKTPT